MCILVARVSVLVFVLVLLVAPVALPYCFSGVPLNGVLCIDAFEDAALLHCVVGLGMKLAWPLQSFIVVLLIILSTSEPLDCVDLVVIVARSFTPANHHGGRDTCPTLLGGHDCRCTKGCGCRNVCSYLGCRPFEEAARFIGFL